MSDINVVPYIDVMLVLLIVFMVTAPLLMQGVKVDLPDAPAEPVGEQDDEPLIVSVKADGQLYINLGDPEKARPLDDITGRVNKVLKRKPKTQVLVWGDSNVRYGQVVELMAALQQAGAPSVG
ncbi:MAG: protein TolR, partial [Oceanisphaera sp.]|nr:protein TolR [Oceanisphaera sp.]